MLLFSVAKMFLALALLLGSAWGLVPASPRRLSLVVGPVALALVPPPPRCGGSRVRSTRLLATTKDWGLRDDFRLADALPQYSMTFKNERYTFWEALRAAQFPDRSIDELQSKGGGRRPPVLDDVDVDGDVIEGTFDRGHFVSRGRIRQFHDVEYFVDTDDRLFEIGSRKDVAPPKKSRWLQRIFSPLGALVLVGLLVFSTLDFRPQTNFYYYSETSSSVIRRAPDGSLDTQTRRNIESNFDSIPPFFSITSR